MLRKFLCRFHTQRGSLLEAYHIEMDSKVNKRPHESPRDTRNSKVFTLECEIRHQHCTSTHKES